MAAVCDLGPQLGTPYQVWAGRVCQRGLERDTPEVSPHIRAGTHGSVPSPRAGGRAPRGRWTDPRACPRGKGPVAALTPCSMLSLARSVTLEMRVSAPGEEGRQPGALGRTSRASTEIFTSPCRVHPCPSLSLPHHCGSGALGALPLPASVSQVPIPALPAPYSAVPPSPRLCTAQYKRDAPAGPGKGQSHRTWSLGCLRSGDPLLCLSAPIPQGAPGWEGNGASLRRLAGITHEAQPAQGTKTRPGLPGPVGSRRLTLRGIVLGRVRAQVI